MAAARGGRWPLPGLPGAFARTCGVDARAALLGQDAGGAQRFKVDRRRRQLGGVGRRLSARMLPDPGLFLFHRGREQGVPSGRRPARPRACQRFEGSADDLVLGERGADPEAAPGRRRHQRAGGILNYGPVELFSTPRRREIRLGNIVPLHTAPFLCPGDLATAGGAAAGDASKADSNPAEPGALRQRRSDGRHPLETAWLRQPEPGGDWEHGPHLRLLARRHQS
mmetsp:Transcript_81253/g.218532  ORF Transcript_81253/g.218532 Transcript_81253/m.218532 type:complete len:225 (+) Transcript_81253:278-952(+)